MSFTKDLNFAEVLRGMHPAATLSSQNEPLTHWSVDSDQSLDASHVNIHMAPSFNPSPLYTTPFSQLLSLDWLPAYGLSEEEFWKLFSRCRQCFNFMTVRTIPYHVCPARAGQFFREPALVYHLTCCFLFISGLWDIFSQTQSFSQVSTRLLDAHDPDNAAGVSAHVFAQIFHVCRHCGRYMVQRVSADNHADYYEDLGASNLGKPCLYL